MRWVDWLRSGSQIVAGLKITAAFLSYVGIGQIGKWLFEKFYPFTRLMWGDLFSWLKFPEISDLEKDALTALLFFIPLAVSSIVSSLVIEVDTPPKNEEWRSDTLMAIFFGSIFFLLICGALVMGLVRAR